MTGDSILVYTTETNREACEQAKTRIQKDMNAATQRVLTRLDNDEE